MTNYTVPNVITFSDTLQLIAVVSEDESDEYQLCLITPLRIDRDYTSTDNGVMESFSLVPWIPFSDSIEFLVERYNILNLTPIGEDYIEDYYNVVERIFYPTRKKKSSQEEHSGMSFDDIKEYLMAITDNKIN